MIKVYNIVSGKYSTHLSVEFNLPHVSNTRGNIYKLQFTLMHYNIRKHFFNDRIVASAIVYLILLFLLSL